MPIANNNINNINLIAYVASESKSSLMHYVAFLQSTSPIALVFISNQFNSILDSGSTMHIFCDCQCFWTYDINCTVPVGTTNCGILHTLAHGQARFQMHVEGKNIIITLEDCLHVLDILINLLFVGSMVEHNLRLLFECGSTSIFFPSSISALNNSSIKALVHNHLSFLFCDFVSPTPVSLSALLAFPALVSNLFLQLNVTPALWHACFGHPEHNAMKMILTKNYVTGFEYNGSFTDNHCIPCILSKRQAWPFDYLQHCASAICDLLHMDTCSPFSILFSNGHANRFHSILDDHLNFGSTALLLFCTQAIGHSKHVEASWELKSGNCICMVCSDNVKEFVLGELHNYFSSCGITHQAMALYAHQQNGKAERYIRTIEDFAQAMMAWSSLLMSFLGNAILTAQYLQNRLPTSTLPSLMTSCEVMENVKPDLSHLCIWSC